MRLAYVFSPIFFGLFSLFGNLVNRSSSPILLAIESSGALCGVALAYAESGEALAELTFSEPFLHDKLLAEAANTLVAMLELSFKDLAAVAVSAGPGSFTGLRIGAAFAKAIAFEDSPPLIAVPTLRALALSAKSFAESLGISRLCVGVPSHKDLFYVQYFSSSAEPESDVALASASAFEPASEVLYVGSAFVSSSHESVPLAPLPSGARTLPAEYSRISPAAVACLAAESYRRRAFVPAAEYTPLYAQDFTPKTSIRA